MADALEESHYNISKYLNELKSFNLVKEKRVGRGVLYFVNEDVDAFIKEIYKAILSIPNDYVDKNIKLLKMRVSLRENNKCVIGVNNPKWKEIVSKIKSDERKETKIKGG